MNGGVGAVAPKEKPRGIPGRNGSTGFHFYNARLLKPLPGPLVPFLNQVRDIQGLPMDENQLV